MAARLLRKTGEAIKHSPAAMKRLMGISKGKYKMELAQADDPFKVGLSYHVDYIGYETYPTTEQDSGEEQKFAQMCEKSVVKVYQEKQPPFKRLVVIVSDQRLTVLDPNDEKSVVRIPLYRIAFCGSHSLFTKTFTFMERSRDGTRTTCHVLACETPTKAQSMVRVVAKAFQNVFLAWSAQQRKERRQRATSTDQPEVAAEAPAEEAETDAAASAPMLNVDEVEKLDVSDEEKERRHMHRTFSRRTLKKTAPDVLDTGALKVKPDDFDIAEAAEFAEPVVPEEPLATPTPVE